MAGSREIQQERPWHAIASEQALEDLSSGENGLEPEEVERRRAEYGPNRLPEKKGAGLLRLFIRQFKSPLIYILLIAGIVSVAIGHPADAGFILAVLLLNAVIGTYQEYKAETSAQALQSVMKIRAVVRRAGRRREVASEELVPGDIVLLESGTSVPADIRLLTTKQLRADESLLTGESTPVSKDADRQLEADTPLGDRTTLAHAGSSVLEGRGTGVVCRTGEHTEVGQIAGELAEQEAGLPPLVLRLQRFTRMIAIVVLVAVAALAAGQLVLGADPIQIFFLAVALSVSAIPAGLPVAITVALAIASNRMAKRNVIVRRLPAVEGLGACTLIASDKTGTLTENRLTVSRLLLPDGGAVEVTGKGLGPEGELKTGDGAPGADQRDQVNALARTGILCNEAEYHVDGDEVHQEGDTLDVALLVLGAKLGMHREALEQASPRVGQIPFESARRYAASFNREEARTVAHVKGATEKIVPMCAGVDPGSIQAMERQLAEDGFRVIALASGEVARDTADEDEPDLSNLNFLGLAGLIDPIRNEVPDAVARCHSAGVDVRMITGDHPATGLAIARRLGIAGTGSRQDVLTGAELGRFADERERDERIRNAHVFARVEPRQKTTIIDSLTRASHFVAVTGDGVNDAPALRNANIGVAMGKGGTDVARGAADLILTDDNFASIVNGIEEGRIAYDNVRKVTWLLISTGAAEIVLFFLALLTGLPLPLDAVQLLWLNLVTNGVQDVALAFERGEPGVLDRPPRPPGEPIFDRLMVEQTVLSGAWVGLVAFGLFYVLMESGQFTEFEARNLLLLLMVLFENVHIFNCRSETRSVFGIPLSNNWLLIGTVAAAQLIHIAALYVPGFSAVLEVAPVTLAQWFTLLPLALSVLLVVELFKRWRARPLMAARRRR